jgi:hypothetical protein
MCRHASFCVSDEQYFGTLLSFSVGEEGLGSAVVFDMAVAMLTDGAGFNVSAVDDELMIEIRGSKSNRTRLPDYQDWHGECHAVERCVLRSRPGAGCPLLCTLNGIRGSYTRKRPSRRPHALHVSCTHVELATNSPARLIVSACFER